MGNQVTTAVSQLQAADVGHELEDGFQNAESCKALNSSSEVRLPRHNRPCCFHQGGGMTTQGYGYADDSMRGAGWLMFAGLMLGLAGTFNIINGIVAVSKARFYTPNAVYVFGDLKTWGWIIMILGVLQILAAFAIYSGSEWGRWFGIACASVNAIGQLLFLPGYPFWSLAMFAVDILIIYGLSAYGGKKMLTA